MKWRCKECKDSHGPCVLEADRDDYDPPYFCPWNNPGVYWVEENE